MAIGDQTFDNDYSFLNLPGQVQEVINPTNVNQDYLPVNRNLSLNEYISNTNLPSNVNANTIEPLITYNQPTPISSQEIFQNNLGGGFIPYGPNNPEPAPTPPRLYRGNPIDRGIDPNAYSPKADPTNPQYNPEAYDADGKPIPGYMPYEGYTPVDDIPAFKTEYRNGFPTQVPINRINYDPNDMGGRSIMDGNIMDIASVSEQVDDAENLIGEPVSPVFEPERVGGPATKIAIPTPDSTPEELTFNFDDPNAPNYTPIFTGLPDFDTKGSKTYNAMANMKYLGSGMDLPNTGDIVQGYRYMGGDVGAIDSWEKYDPNKSYAPIGSSSGTAGYSMFKDGGEVNEIQILLKKLR